VLNRFLPLFSGHEKRRYQLAKATLIRMYIPVAGSAGGIQMKPINAPQTTMQSCTWRITWQRGPRCRLGRRAVGATQCP